ncbi:MAG: peptidase MA family metallohydrolase [bacterium]|nr:peptidase MA family metallohydrolase [candidate division KSB1 bacterium]MDH7560694.1 peptidase MA family metallohydrolase [bacterium]
MAEEHGEGVRLHLLRDLFRLGLLLLAASDTIAGQQPEWLELAGEGVVVHFVVDDQRIAALVLKRAEQAYATIAQELAPEGVPRVDVVLAPSAGELATLTEGRLPRWAVGAMTLEAHGPTVYLPSPRWGPSGAELDQTIVHEMAHALVAVASNYQQLPRWLTEGIAIHYSREQQWTSPSQVSKALLTNSLLSLEDVEQLNSYPEHKARLAYQESFLAVQYLRQTYSLQAMRTLLAGIGQGRDLDAAFENAIGKDSWEFEQEWRKYLRHRYRWTFLAEADWYLWVLILLLAVGAFLAVRARTRRIARTWIEEEANRSDTEQPWETH